MRVDPKQGVFHCFACGAGGDAISSIGLQFFGPSFNHRDSEMFKKVLEALEHYDVPRVEYRPPPRPKELNQYIVQVLTLSARVCHLALMRETSRPRELLGAERQVRYQHSGREQARTRSLSDQINKEMESNIRNED
jgi:DNA primase